MRERLDWREYTDYVGAGRSGVDCTSSVKPRQVSGEKEYRQSEDWHSRLRVTGICRRCRRLRRPH